MFFLWFFRLAKAKNFGRIITEMITGPINLMLNIPLMSHQMNSINLVGYCLLMPENCACERSKRMSEVFPFPKLNSFLPEFGINRSLFLATQCLALAFLFWMGICRKYGRKIRIEYLQNQIPAESNTCKLTQLIFNIQKLSSLIKNKWVGKLWLSTFT